MLKDKRLFLFDIDGVIKLGDELIDGALQLFDYINKIGGKSIFITNNSTKGALAYVDYFKAFGFDVKEDNFITALTISVDYLKKYHADDLIFVVGTHSMVKELEDNGLHVVQEVVDNIDVVLVGYDNELTFKKIVDVCNVLQTQDVVYLATNLDIKCPMPFGYIPDCGAICNFIKMATDKQPKYLGKPASDMVEYALEKNGFTKAQAIVVGDRLYTDIACGINAGVDSCVVFTGEAKPEDLADTEFKPTYAFDDVYVLWQKLVNGEEK